MQGSYIRFELKIKCWSEKGDQNWGYSDGHVHRTEGTELAAGEKQAQWLKKEETSVNL